MKGAPWTREEEAKLLMAFDTGLSCEAIAALHDRTKGAVITRLVALGKLVEARRAYYPVQRPWATWDELRERSV